MKPKIISGGQTGVDQAALDAAIWCGLETGGWAPKGWRTLTGPNPGLAAYGLREHKSWNYRDRTWANIEDSDCTVRIARNFQSPGELCTAKGCRIFFKNSHDVDLRDAIPPKELAHYLASFNYTVINVAGNSEQTVPGIYAEAYNYLTEMFDELKKA